MVQPTDHTPLGIVYAVTRKGHRGAYLDLFAEMFSLIGIEGKLNRRLGKQLLEVERLLFATLDDTVIGFTWTALVRSLRGRRTVGIMLRPQSCRRDGTPAARVKYWLFRVLASAPYVTILSIVPHPLCPDGAAVSTQWVHDPQLWDYKGRTPTPDQAFSARIKQTAAGRRIISFVGGITEIKGVALLADIAARLSKKYLIVVAGNSTSDAKGDVQRLLEAGVMVENRWITDREVEALYEVADLVWCCYRPDYDQASGVFGRAIQFGRTAIVRDGSMISRYSELADISTLSIPWGDPDTALQLIMTYAPSFGKSPIAPVSDWRTAFEKHVRDAL